jgi:hypothetical protein
MNQAELEAYLRAFSRANGWGNATFGLDDLDFGDFIKDLAHGIITEFRQKGTD